MLITICLLILLNLNDQENDVQMLRVLSVQFGCVTIPLTIAHVSASKRKFLVEIFEVCILLPFVASAYVLYLVLLPNMT